MKPDLQAALQAAERMQRYDAGEDPLTIWPEMRLWCELQSLGGTDHKIRYFGTEAFVSGDQEILADAYLAILRNPAEHVEELLEKPVWCFHSQNMRRQEWRWETPFGTYQLVIERGKVCWAILHKDGPHDCESEEEAKSACWLDFVERVKPMLRATRPT